MVRFIIPVLSCLFLFSPVCFAQVSYGGMPLPEVVTRGADDGGTFRPEEMPTFDVAEELRIDSLNESDLRSGYRFAYKFVTEFNRDNSGMSFVLPDGTRVWRLGIRSAGALSINVLFTEYELPEGARLFLYNKERTHILGAFNHLNNSELGILPVSPVRGEELVIEYQEPADAPFAGRLTVGEVNHAYRSLRGDEPKGNNPAQDFCMEPLACSSGDEKVEAAGRSVVLLILDGTTACSGTMINNTANDGKPYLLTASHCINKNFTITRETEFDRIAGSVVCYFNYNSPLCTPILRGAEEMSVASARRLALNEKHDLALLELLEPPPVYYQPYYAGWNRSERLSSPFFGIHHPNSSVKRVSWADEIVLKTFSPKGLEDTFAAESHWHIGQWTAGCTSSGSSGSPLFDAGGHVVGGLTGGFSDCDKPTDDYYYAFFKAWKPEEAFDKQLAHWLNPSGGEVLSCEGLDPYKKASAVRLSNVRASGRAEEIEVTSFGDSCFAEAYRVTAPATVYGAYIVTPSIGTSSNAGLDVEVRVYGGTNKPETLLYTESFRPTYQNRVKADATFTETSKPLNRSQESFIRFAKPVQVNSRMFFVGCKINSLPKGVSFTAYSLPDKATAQNTAWLLAGDTWTEAGAHLLHPMRTSFFIDPVAYIEPIDSIPFPPVGDGDAAYIFTGADRKSLHLLLPEGAENARLSVIAANGRIVGQYPVPSSQETVTITLPPGIYVAKLVYGDKQHIQKIVL
ncbi:Protease 1 precursor [Bacteroidales bacterium Barb6XT]|nr:Protease 1 precursor [Bacteroidales bacterium Barb6XT]